MTTKKWILFLAPVLMLGACRSDSSSSSSLVGDWVNRFSFNGVARSEAVAFTIGSKSYVGLGWDGINRFSDFWEYDANSGLWRRVKTFPGVARSGAVGFAVNGKGYVGTGIDNNLNRLSDFYAYTPGTSITDSGSWVRVTDFPGTARQDATAFAIGNNGYVGTGYDGNYLKDFWQYTPSSDTWTQIAFPGNKRREATAFVIGAKAYFMTGINNGLAVNDMWMFDPTVTTNGGWTQRRDIANTSTDSYDDTYTTITRSNASSFVIHDNDGKDRGYIASGENGSSPNDCWEYDTATDVWTKKTAFEGAPRSGAVGISVNQRGFILTGRNGNSPYDDFWEFLPNNAQVLNN